MKFLWLMLFLFLSVFPGIIAALCLLGRAVQVCTDRRIEK